MRQWLLTIDVFTSSQRRQRDRRVHVVWDGHIDRIDLVALFFQELSPVLVAACLGKLLGRFGHSRRIDIADSYDLNVRVRAKALEIAPSHSVCSDTGMVQLAIGRFRESQVWSKGGKES